MSITTITAIMITRPRSKRIGGVLSALSLILFVLAACGPAATPVVIEDNSAESTLTAAYHPTITLTPAKGPPTPTSTPYVRPTDDSTLPLTMPIVKVGSETFTLGQFRERVRYERFAALNNALQLINTVGLANLNFTQSGDNPTADNVAAIFNTLADANGFGQQVYNIMIRESIIRQEFTARKLTLNAKDVRDYWVRDLDMQTVPNIDAALPAAEDAYIATAMNYSGLSRDDIMQIFNAAVMSMQLRPIVAKTLLPTPGAITYELKEVITKTQADADAAFAAIKQGTDFRMVACQYSTDPAAKGNGDLGYLTQSGFTPVVNDSAPVFQAKQGDLLGPLAAPLGWRLFRIIGTRKNADGDTELDAQTILVTTEDSANDLKTRITKGEDFGALACQYSTDPSAGNGGDYGYVLPSTLPAEAAQAVQASTTNALLGPIATSQGYYVIQITDRKADIPSPQDLSQEEDQAFQSWQDSRADSDFVTALSDVWQKAIPADPLPRDVSSLMREENFGLPTLAPTGTAAR